MDKPVLPGAGLINGWQAPDRIWLHDLGGGDVTWCEDRDPDGEQIEAVEYVRALTTPRPLEVGEGEVTEEMLRAGKEAFLNEGNLTDDIDFGELRAIYRAMLAVSPAGQRGE